MGFSDMPYIIVKHQDIDRHHIHIVALRVRPDGSAISDRNNFYRSKEICRELERKYGLHTAERQKITPDMPIRKMIPPSDIKRQVANTVKMVGMRYRFQSVGEYNAILGLYNVKCEPTDGRVNGREYHGLVYYALDDSGNIIASPFKASRLGRFASRTAIDGRFERSKEKTDIRPLRRVVAEVIERSSGKDDFIAGLKERNIDLVLRYTDEGRIYGVTFIDHDSTTVLNGSRLGKEFSANALENWFRNPSDKLTVTVIPQNGDTVQQPETESHRQDNTDTSANGRQSSQSHRQEYGNRPDTVRDDIPSLPGPDGLFQTGPGFDAEEEAFYRATQRRKKRNAVARNSNCKFQNSTSMSQQEDDLRALAKIMDLLRGLSIAVMVANMYWFCQPLISGWEFHPRTMKILRGLDEAGNLFHNPWNAKWWTLLLLALSCFGTKGVKNENIRWGQIWLIISIITVR